MPHFYESSIIITKDNVYCKVFANEHPEGYIIAKPKYIPTSKVFSSSLPMRYIFGNSLCRLDMWIDKDALTKYIEDFKKAYPDYFYNSRLHSNWFFAVPKDKIERVYDARNGLKELIKIPEKHLDEHLRKVLEFVRFLSKSGLSLDSFGITHSTLAGHYVNLKSDINIVVFGKENYWKLMSFLKSARHPLLRWKTDWEWAEFHKKRSRRISFTEDELLYSMKRKKSEGFFNDSLFIIFGVEEPNETWEKWGQERYIPLGLTTVQGEVVDNFNSGVRPGFYGIKNSKILDGENVEVKKVVFYSRDYVQQALVGEKIEAGGLLEKVEPNNGKAYYRIVTGYFDASLNERREKEYIKVIH